ncbi:MAG: anthranilate phosphoribosyltransferase [Gammaproteobacteria bacterium]|nr:MAG: anthranilate phosphoribosyltransferase [Gammaproteobacteria bacterium]
MNDIALPEPQQLEEMMVSIIQRIATGPDLSKDISQEEARLGMLGLLENAIDPVQAAIFLIALRMKRETRDENRGALQAIMETTDRVTAEVDELVDLAEPFDGYNRTLPASPFLAPLLAEMGVPVVTHGLDKVGPKYGITHRHVLAAAGVPVDLNTRDAVARLGSGGPGWAYVDQAQYNPRLHNLIGLRRKMIKRSVITTVEVLAKPITGREKTHFVTGYVHKPYPPVYADLARFAGFNSALLIRGVEGGVVPSLRQAGKYFAYHDGGEEIGHDIDPGSIGITSETRCVPVPDDVPQTAKGEGTVTITDTEAGARRAAELGLAALRGQKGSTYDSLVYSAALILHHLGRTASLEEGAAQVRSVLDSGRAAERVI